VIIDILYKMYKQTLVLRKYYFLKQFPHWSSNWLSSQVSIWWWRHVSVVWQCVDIYCCGSVFGTIECIPRAKHHAGPSGTVQPKV